MRPVRGQQSMFARLIRHFSEASRYADAIAPHPHQRRLADRPKAAAGGAEARHLTCETRCVSTRDEYVRALDDFGPDLVITDYFLGDFDGLQVLELTKARSPQTPVIVLTNALSEETAVECMKRGAVDYVLKNRLPHIVPTVTALLERQHIAREKARLEREHEQLFQLTPNLFCLADLGGTLQEVNPPGPPGSVSPASSSSAVR